MRQIIKTNIHHLIGIRQERYDNSVYDRDHCPNELKDKNISLKDSYALLKDEHFMFGYIGTNYAHDRLQEAIRTGGVNWRRVYQGHRHHDYVSTLPECHVCQDKAERNTGGFCDFHAEQGWWVDPAGGVHEPDTEDNFHDPAAMYE